MARTTDPVTPGTFLAELRTAFPQFAEVNRSSSKGFGAQYAQQGWLCDRIRPYIVVENSIRCGRVLVADDPRVEGCERHYLRAVFGVYQICRPVYDGHYATRVSGIL